MIYWFTEGQQNVCKMIYWFTEGHNCEKWIKLGKIEDLENCKFNYSWKVYIYI